MNRNICSEIESCEEIGNDFIIWCDNHRKRHALKIDRKRPGMVMGGIWAVSLSNALREVVYWLNEEGEGERYDRAVALAYAAFDSWIAALRLTANGKR